MVLVLSWVLYLYFYFVLVPFISKVLFSVLSMLRVLNLLPGVNVFEWGFKDCFYQSATIVLTVCGVFWFSLL